MKDQPLAQISNELIETGEFLSEFAGDKLRCIESFCECQQIVRWIKKTTERMCKYTGIYGVFHLFLCAH